LLATPSAAASERIRAPDLSRHRQTTKEIGTMATNLVSSIMQFLTPDMVAKIARTLGIDPDVAQKVVSAAVPAILASFAGLAAKPAGAQQLSETLEQQRPDMLSQITGAIGGPDQKAIADTGSSLLSTLLGAAD
jgi:hypothetical protein